MAEESESQRRFRHLVLEVLDAIDQAQAGNDVSLVANSAAVDALRREMTGW